VRRQLAAALVAGALAFGATRDAFAVPAAELVQRAQSSASRADWNDAARALEEVVAAGYDSSDVLYDLGTVYVHAGRFGEAIWRFEQVNRRSVFSGNAQHNLRAARLRLAHRDAGRSGRAVVETATPWSIALGEVLPLDWAVAFAVVCELVALLCLALWRRRHAGEIARVASAVGGVVAVGAAVFFASIVVARHTAPPAAIVLHDALRLRREPAADAIAEAPVREGERVEVIGRNGVFVRVRAIDGGQGWLAARDLGLLDE
jgi:hypothetical protein